MNQISSGVEKMRPKISNQRRTYSTIYIHIRDKTANM